MTLSACGEGSKQTPSSTKVSQLSPVQYENYQRLGAYVKAVSQIEARASHSANFGLAVTNLRRLIAGLSALSPPPQLTASHERLLKGFRGELTTSLEYEAGQKAHNAAASNKARQKNAEAEQATRAALAEDVAEVRKCEGDRFSC
jgi:hypothetical protein